MDLITSLLLGLVVDLREVAQVLANLLNAGTISAAEALAWAGRLLR